MKITEYAKVTNPSASSVMLIDGENGTKGVLLQNAIKAMINMLSASELAAPLDLEALDAATTISAGNKMLFNDGDNQRGITAQNVARSLINFLTATELIDPLVMNDLSSKSTFASGDKMLIGQSDGSNVAVNVEDALFACLDQFAPVEVRRVMFRGKNLGTSLTAEQKANIKNGTFKGFFLGDYWVINNITYRIVDFNYWWFTGDTVCKTPHLVIMPDSNLYNQRMEATNITTNGYAGSEMRTSGLNNAKTTINAAFGAGNILSHREYFTSASSNGKPSAGAWYDSTVDLPNEIMLYGCPIFTVSNTGDVPTLYTVDKTQLALMAMVPRFIRSQTDGQHSWIRDIVSAAYFACVNNYGLAGNNGASNPNLGVRPVFGVTGLAA